MESARNLLIVFLAAFLTGCGPSGPPLGSVEGTVTLDGEPVEAAFITFSPNFDGMEVTGKTDDQGHYQMQFSVDREGVPLGEYKVSISTFDNEKQPDGSNKVIKERIPKHYIGFDSILTFTVEEGANMADFELSKKKP